MSDPLGGIFLTHTVDCVPQKVTTFSIITLTISVRLQ